LFLSSILSGCNGVKSNVCYAPSEAYLIKSEVPELGGRTNLDLYKYADTCVIRLNECNSKLDSIKKESQKFKD